jgi:hypothetical protein
VALSGGGAFLAVSADVALGLGPHRLTVRASDVYGTPAVASVVFYVGQNNSFPDVNADYWAWRDIEATKVAGIVGGYDDGLYHPDWPVTREQMAIYIAHALAGGADVPAASTPPSFWDVPADHWAFDCIEFAVDQGVVYGYPEGDYKPSQEVDRSQMAVYIARAMVAPTGEAALADYVPPAEPSFPDVPADFWTYPHIEWCVQQGIVQGYPYPDPENPAETIYRYEPNWIVARDQMAIYVARSFGLTLR